MTLGTGNLSHISELLVLCKEPKLFSLPSPLFFYKILLLLYIVLSPLLITLTSGFLEACFSFPSIAIRVYP